MEIITVTPPAEEPVTYSEAKEYLRADLDIEQALIESYITAAREFCENYQNKTYLTKTLKAVYNSYSFPLTLTLPPIQSVAKIEFQQADGTLVEWGANNYIVDSSANFGKVRLADDSSIPENLAEDNILQITYTAGYETVDQVSKRVKTAMKLLIAIWYEKRLPIENAMNYELPFTISALLNQDRVMPV